ncbi:MAG: hypothetical protein JST30_06695 [Armatimonadetes bacterium]|nr:hypothetical protein [Armatimonadota bacterium]
MAFVRRHGAVLALALLPLCVLWRAVFFGEAVGPWGQILQMAPWNGPVPDSAWDVLQADGVLQFHPWRDLVFESWRTGHLPLWNPYQLCGTPLLANSQSAGFYPLHVLVGVLHVPTVLGIALLAWFHLAWAGLGARALAKVCGANEEGALIAGVVFGLSAFLVAWSPLASVVTTCSWIPWCLFCAKRLAGSDRKAAWTACLALSTAMMLLGGHLQFAAYGLIGLVVFSGVILVQHRSRATVWGAAVGAAFLGAMMAMPQVLPALEFSKQSHRQVGPSPEGAAAYASAALRPPELLGFVVASVTGLPGNGWRPEPGGTVFPSYWPAYVKRGAAMAESALSLGPVAFALLFLQRKGKARRQAGPLAVALVGLLLALGPLSVLLYWVLPGWSATGSPGRAAVLAVLGLAVWAGTLWPVKDDRSLPARALVGLGIGFVASVAGAFLAAGTLGSYLVGFDGLGAIVNFDLVSPVPAGLSVLLAGAGLALIKFRPQWAAPVCVLSCLCAGPLFCLPTGKPPPPPKTPEPMVRRAFVNADWELLLAARAVMPGNTATTSRLYDVGGYDSLLDKTTLETLRAIDAGKDPAPPANGNMMFVKPDFDPVRLAEAGVTEVWSLRPLPQMSAVPRQDGRHFVYGLPGPGRVTVSDGQARIVRDTTEGQTVEVLGPTELTVRDRSMPGWSATVDGRPVPITAEGPWRHVSVPEGATSVEFRYAPPGLRTGATVGGFGLLVTAVLLAAGLRKRPSEPAGVGQEAHGSIV